MIKSEELVVINRGLSTMHVIATSQIASFIICSMRLNWKMLLLKLY